MKILVLGDSTTFGAELSDLPVKYFGPYGNDYVDKGELKFSQPSSRAWPAVLATRLGCQVSNQSIVGGSNDRIFRLAIEQTLQHHWDLVICAWTSVNRFDLTDGKRDLAITARVHWEFKWVKQFIDAHWDQTRADTNFVTKLAALQGYFAQRNQPYLFVKSTRLRLCKEAVLLEKHLDQTYLIDWNNDFYSWTTECPKGADGHILEQGQQKVANILYQYIKDKSLIHHDV